MSKISQYLLIILATLSVSILGYHAYSLATDTLVTSFIGQESQHNNTLRVALAKPWIQFWNMNQETAINRDALIAATSKNGKPWRISTEGWIPMADGNSIGESIWDGKIVVDGTYIEVLPANWIKGDTITISASIYNSQKKIGWKFPRDMTTTYSDDPHNIEIRQIGLPRDMSYELTTYGYTGLDTSDVRWYIKKMGADHSCGGLSGWGSWLWTRVKTRTIENHTVSQKKIWTYSLELSEYPSDSCIIVGLGGDIQSYLFAPLDTFTATGIITDILSPEYDMQSRIEFHFTTDIFTDTGVLYSSEYMQHRQSAKIAFLKHLSISNNITIWESDLELSPNRATVYASFIEWETYHISLDTVEDIYGRTTSTVLDMTAKAIPSLSMKIVGNKTIIKYGDAIDARLYRSQWIKNEYDIKLCQVWSDWYARIERLNELKNKEHIPVVYSLLWGNDVSNCVIKSITMSPGSVISNFDVNEFYPKWLTPGLYVMAFAREWDISSLEKWVSPRVFSVVDTHITMKLDTTGKIQLLATDIRTGEPRSEQSITLRENISQLYTQKWNQGKQSYDIAYTPLSALSWWTGITIGKTSWDGVLQKDQITLADGSQYNPYNLTNEWGDYEGRYSSFIAVSKWGGHFGYVVSTWNDGITGWNFGMKESDYGWENRSLYSVYMHTDRRLYLPWEMVYIKAYIRENKKTLTIPEWEQFDITISDQEWKEVAKKRIKSNNYWSIATELTLAKDASLGSYSIYIQDVKNPNIYITNGYANFQVEIFKNPTFTAEVQLSSPQVKNGIIQNIREVDNTDTSNPWYDKSYKSNITIEWNVKAHYYNGAQIKSTPFTYRIYKSIHYNMSDWWDCFWWCYYEQTPEFYTEGTGSIDADGYGIFRTDVEFSSFSDDYIYTAEVTLIDPLTSETIVTPASLLVALGQEHKMYDRYNPVEATLDNKMVQPGTSLEATIGPKHGKWDQTMSNKYKYELIHRVYTAEQISTLRGESAPITHTIDTIVSEWALTGNHLTLATKWYTPWEYILQISPITPSDIMPPIESISETLIYITGNFVSRDASLRVIPERTVYHSGETAHVLITTPFSSWGHLYITREKWGVLEHEYITYTGSNYTRDYVIDDSFYPNVYIGVVAFPRWSTGSDRGYAVWYGEIIMDLSDKKWKLNIAPNKEIYKNRDTVNMDLLLTDTTGKWTEWEIEVMVIDESLIRLLGNIDLDIIPKFFQKYQFTMKTALTAIGIERNRYLSRKGSNGGSGDKWWDGVQISSRTLFRNTAYYNPSVLSDKNGKAHISFALPDNVTDYRIIAIWQTKSSTFSVSEKTISVRQDYTLETHASSLAYPGDMTTITASVFNSTPQISEATLELNIGTGGSLWKKIETLILSPGQAVWQDYKIVVWKVWNWDIPYTLTLRDKKWIILDSISKNLHIAQPPIITDMIRVSGSTATGVIVAIPAIWDNTSPDSQVTISISDSPLQNPERVIASLIAYPYGCIEQTISSTLPNAIALALWSSLGIKIDTIEARKNLEAGVEKILKMQDANGGWKYWENDTVVNDHITPYVIRSLYEFRKLGITIPDDNISRWLDYISSLPVTDDMDSRAEIFATLAQGKHPRTPEVENSIDITRLSRHGYLIYSIGLASLDKLDNTMKKNLKTRMSSRHSESYWYWDDTADQAIYARLLVQLWDRAIAATIIRDLLQWVDLESYYVSTQSRIQLLMALISLSGGQNTLSQLQITTWKLKIPISMSKWAHRYSYDTRRSLIGKTLDISWLSGTGIVYYEISMRDEPIDIFAVQGVSHPELTVSRVFEKVDESRWLDQNWQFISATPITDSIFHHWELYRVRITVTPKPSNTNKYYLTLEDYIPGGWRPISSILKTESMSTTDTNSEYGYWNGWTHVESQLDRIFATQDYIWRTDKPYTYTYYIRPEYSGTYLLPPVTAYYMYQPYIHATGKYEKITVK